MTVSCHQDGQWHLEFLLCENKMTKKNMRHIHSEVARFWKRLHGRIGDALSIKVSVMSHDINIDL